MTHRAQLKKSPSKRKNLKKINKVECVNNALMERLKKHFVYEYKLGECTILSKTEQREINIQSLKNSMSNLNMQSRNPNHPNLNMLMKKKSVRDFKENIFQLPSKVTQTSQNRGASVSNVLDQKDMQD